MAKGEILEKLRQAITASPLTEYHVVCILSRIRKCLELDKYEHHVNDYHLLNLYCDWALHAVIDRTRRIENILNKIPTDPKREFQQFVPLKTELKKFLTKNDLPTDLITDGERWLTFIELLSQVYKDTPLIVDGPQPKEIVLTEARRVPGGDSLRFGMLG